MAGRVPNVQQKILAKERTTARIIKLVGDIIKTLIRCACVFGIFYFGFECFKLYAGKDTNIKLLTDIAFKVIGEFKADQYVAYILALFGAGYGWAERKLRRSKTKALTSRIVELEEGIDPGRSSSGLLSTGVTREGD